MRKILLLIVIHLSFGYMWAQHELPPIAKDISAYKTQAGKSDAFKTVSLFTQAVANKQQKYQDAFSEGVVLELNKARLSSLFKTKDAALRFTLPFNKGNINVELLKVVQNDILVETNVSATEKYSTGIYYRGIIDGDHHSTVTLSIFDDDVAGIISSPSLGNIVLAKAKNSDEYIFYSAESLKDNFGFVCGTPDDQEIMPVYPTQNISADKALHSNKRVRIYYEVANDIYKAKGSSVEQTVNWINAVHNNVSTLYYNEGLRVDLHKVYVWTTVDPYANETSSATLLPKFRQNRATFDGDLAHFVNLKSQFGGRAYYSSCTSSNKHAFSGLFDSSSNVPTYSWTVEVITHEIGHNLGSPHTQSCFWNGNNTAIDGCVSSEANPWNTSITCPNGPMPAANGGTIMSYCHTQPSVGINLSLGFGTQPGNVIRNNVAAGTCFNSSRIYYVKPGATGDGTSWTNAGNLSYVLRHLHNNQAASNFDATIPVQVWVQKGTHVPTHQYGGGATRDRTFVLVKDVQIFGGFNGDETRLEQRKAGQNETILDGGKVSAHVVVSAGAVGAALLDGFTIMNGNAASDNSFSINGQTIDHRYGGGILMNNSSPAITNSIFKNNYSVNRGGAVYMLNDSKPVFQNVVFTLNEAGSNGDGGAIYTDTNNNRGFLTLINCTIANNKASDGGAIRFNHNITVKFSNNIFYNNTSTNNSGTLNSEFSFNFSESDFSTRNSSNIKSNIFQYYTKGTDTYNQNPQLENTFRLSSSSPAINKGKNDLYIDVSANIVKSQKDVESKTRIVNTTIDLGASERQCTISAPVTANQTIVLCGVNKVSDLISKINSPTILVYASTTAYDPLASTATLTNGQTYYITKVDTSGCTSSLVPVKVSIVAVPTAPAVTQPAVICAGQVTLGQLSVAGANHQWYSAATGGNILPAATVIERNKTYYVSQNPNGCESARTAFTANKFYDLPAAPVVTQPAATCAGQLTLGQLSVTGSNLKWYNAATGGNVLPANTVIEPNETYYVSQNPNGCESPRATFIATSIYEIPAAPAVTQPAEACEGTVSLGNVVVSGTGEVRWYDAAVGGNQLESSTIVKEGVTYYVSRRTNNCESVRTSFVALNIKAYPAAPTGNTSQTLPFGSKVSDIEILSSSNVTWYATQSDANANINPLANDHILVTGKYYPVSSNGTCRTMGAAFNITIEAVLGTSQDVNKAAAIYPSPFRDVLYVKNDAMITNIKIYSATGSLIFNKNLNVKESSINTQQFPAGVYTVKLTTGNREIIKKVIKK
ncbi:MAG: T9SS type A sorting domain-containing protein [Flavobacteriia bacterium]|nr:T9SS type A sorting domain-containing protein [Flavobacteriia bacterium]MBH2025135.1 T9SS type A sorting domain-containing protein [Flavobacteriales bacterium]